MAKAKDQVKAELARLKAELARLANLVDQTDDEDKLMELKADLARVSSALNLNIGQSSGGSASIPPSALPQQGTPLSAALPQQGAPLFTLPQQGAASSFIDATMAKMMAITTVGKPLVAEGQPMEENPLSEWSKLEESDFMRVLWSYGIKLDNNNKTVIVWGEFKELSAHLQNKTDTELLEMFQCVIAMCAKQQGQGHLLTAIGEGLAGRVLQTLSARHAEKLMCRVYLMQKVRAIMAFGVQNMQERPELVPMDVMPKGWTKAHDEELLVAVDKFGLEDIIGKVKSTKLFESVATTIDENLLLGRLIEICKTLASGKWDGPVSIENVQEEAGDDLPCTSSSGTKKMTHGHGNIVALKMPTQRKFQCTFCDYSADEKPTLKNHVRSKHSLVLTLLDKEFFA